MQAAAAMDLSSRLIPLFSTLRLSLRIPAIREFRRSHCNFHIRSFSLQVVTLRLRFGILFRLSLLRLVKLPVVETVALLYCIYVIKIQTVWFTILTPA